MIKKNSLFVLCCALSLASFSQVILKAEGTNDTYKEINDVLAPGSDVTEVPDCGHTFAHIDQVLDEDINDYAFRFHLHVENGIIDTDRCKSNVVDKQRNEIKTFDQSPDNLLGIEGETVVYKWKFKLDADFQSSADFTHLHQIKGVGGDEDEISTPSISLTTREGKNGGLDQLELRYAAFKSQSTVHKVNLDPFKGNWVEVVETITYGEEIDGGAYEILIVDMDSKEVLMEYEDVSIRMWNTGADFLRPKWGIYRSIKSIGSLRDEAVLYTDFSIEEVSSTLSTAEFNSVDNVKVYQDFSSKELVFSNEAIKNNDSFIVYNIAGELVFNAELTTNRVSLDGLSSGLYIVKLPNEKDKTKVLKIIID